MKKTPLIQVTIPELSHYHFRTILETRIYDMNYDDHLGNVELQNLMHEARLRLLKHFGLSEAKFGNGTLVMTESWVRQQTTCFYGDSLEFKMAFVQIGKVRFSVFYDIDRVSDGKKVALALTEMTLIDGQGKPMRLPEEFSASFQQPS